MPLRNVPRWLRTALVFLASLQAARAGSVEAQSLTNHRMEQATATSAPRDPILALSEPIPIAVVLVTEEQRHAAVEPRAVARAPNSGTSFPARAAAVPLVVAEPAPAVEVGVWPGALSGRFAPAHPETRNACRARAPCSALPLD